MKIGKRKLSRLVKLLILANTYHEDPEWDSTVKDAVNDMIFDMALRWNFPPDIFNKVKSYNEAMEYIIKEQRNKNKKLKEIKEFMERSGKVELMAKQIKTVKE